MKAVAGSDALKLLTSLGWYEWLCHTNFSFLLGASHPHEYLERALQLGYAGLAVTDMDGVYGLARTHINRRKLAHDQGLELTPNDPNKLPLRLFYGAELHLSADHDLPVCFQDTVVLIARTATGYGQLCRLLTRSHRDGKKYAHLPLPELLAAAAAGQMGDLVVIQPMRGLVRRLPAELETRLGIFKESFSERFYLAISRHLNPAEDVWLAPTLAAARTLGLPCLLTQDAFFHEPRQKDMSDLLHAIRTNLTLEAAVSHMFVNSERSLHDLAGLARRFGELPIYRDALRQSRQLAESCVFSMAELKYYYPKEMIPPGHTSQSFLEQLVWEAAKERLGERLTAKITKTIAHELKLIETLMFADYFLTVWEIVHWARSRQILCQGRGSAANSAVCFVLGITAVDPADFDLLFERFMSMERGDPPDIDVDFEHERREEVIQHIYERYGRHRAAMVANVITFRRKGALRAVGKALGVAETSLGEVSKRLETRGYRGSAAAEVVEEGELDDDLGGGDDDLSPRSVWAELAERLHGFPRHLSIHSGGFMLSDGSLDALVPQEPATMPGRTVVQWCKEDIEGLGFFKIDILALGMLTAIRKSFAAIETHYGRQLTIASIPADDKPTYEMIQRADTVGTFQIESRAQMSMLPRLKPAKFYDLVIEVAIIRPGPIQGGMIHPYLRRRDGTEQIDYPDERLRPILHRTLGIPIFQEQVMRIAIAVGDFTPGESNELRRNMGNWSMKGDMGPWTKKLAIGMRKNGLNEDFIQSILGQLRGFAHYGFPESHAVSFALLAYASSWLKRHYPAAFFMGLLNAQPMGFYSPHALLQTAKRDKVKLLPICVQHSDWDAKLERLSDGDSDAVDADGKPVFGLRLGMRLVAGLNQKAALNLMAARAAAGGFQSLDDVLRGATLYRNDLTALAAADAFHRFGLSRKSALWVAEAAPFQPALEDVEAPVAFAEESSMERIQQDFAATGTSLGPHPTLVVRDECWCYEVGVNRLVAAEDMAKVEDGRTVQVFGMVLVRQAPPSANGMVFLTLEDETGFFNLVFTPNVYERFFDLVERQSFLCVRGKVQRRGDAHSLMVMHIYAPQLRRADVIPLTVPAQQPSPRTPDAAALAVEAVTRTLAPSRNYM